MHRISRVLARLVVRHVVSRTSTTGATMNVRILPGGEIEPGVMHAA